MSEKKDSGFFANMGPEELRDMVRGNLGSTGPAQAQETHPKLLHELPKYHFDPSLVPLQRDHRSSQVSQVRELPLHKLVIVTQLVN